MAAFFTAASTQYLVNSAPSIVDYPITVGMWVNLTAVGTVARTLWALSDTGTTNNYLLLRMNASEQPVVAAAAGGTESAVGTTGALAAGRWTFLVARFISSTNRRIAQLRETGEIRHNVVIAARAPVGMDTMTLGALSTSGGITEPWDGLIGESWYTNVDVQEDGAQLLDDTLRQLAYGGPFSIPHIAKDIIEYRSLRKYPSSEGDEIGEVFHGAAGRQIWGNTNGVTIGEHPPLPYWYKNPIDFRRMGIS